MRITQISGKAILTATVGAMVALSLSACSGDKKDKEHLVYEERPVELLYDAGGVDLDNHNWSEATDYFKEVERQHPYSEWARRALVMTIYAQYMANQYDETISACDRFTQLYPGSPLASYAYYMKAISYFEQIADVGRDQGFATQAQAALKEVVQRFPRSNYAADARIKIDMVNDQLAGKEMSVGRYYLRNHEPLSAMGRFKTVIDRFQTTSHTPEALYRLVEADLTLGLRDDAVRNGAVLGYNYPGDKWYGAAYRLLNAKGLKPAIPPVVIKHGLFNIGNVTADQTKAPKDLGKSALPPPGAEDTKKKGWLDWMKSGSN